MSAYQPKTGARCTCKAGRQRDNCARCEGTGMVIDHAEVRRAVKESLAAVPCISDDERSNGPSAATRAALAREDAR